MQSEVESTSPYIGSASKVEISIGVYTAGILLYRYTLYGNLYVMPIPQVEIDI